MTRALLPLLAFAGLLLAGPAVAQETGLPALTMTTGEDGNQTWSLSFQVLVAMTLVTLLPALLLSMTGFVRIIVVLGLLRQALGTGQTPSNPILLGLALLLTAFIMQPPRSGCRPRRWSCPATLTTPVASPIVNAPASLPETIL